MARRVKMKSNPALAEPHAAGATVFILQPLVHDRHGAIAYAYPQLWEFHYQLAKRASAAMLELHQRVLRIEPGRSGIRGVTDEPLLLDVYASGNALVSHAVRAVQHLAEEIERIAGARLSGKTSVDRINEATNLFSSEQFSADPDYGGFTEIVLVRDAIEHPQGENVANADWGRVPLAWMLSNRSTDGWSRFSRWFERIAAAWETHRASLPPTPGEITVERGIESQVPVKKPPSS